MEPTTAPNITLNGDPVEKRLRLTLKAQQHVSNFVASAIAVHKRNTEFIHKMDIIDTAYARYKELTSSNKNSVDGVDIRSVADVPCDVFAADNVVPPIVVSQVDTYVAYLAEVFLSGTPLFPVVSNPANRIYAEQLETLLDDHALLGAYPRHLLMFLRDAVKYNYAGIEVEWDSIDQFNIAGDFTTGTGQKLSRDARFYNKLKRLNPRNILRDMTCLPGDVATQGDYAGYIERVSRMRVKTELNKLTKQGKVYNAGKAMIADAKAAVIDAYYNEDPQVSNYINSPNSITNGRTVDWDVFFEGPQRNGRKQNYGDQFYRIVMYARILPSDFEIGAPQPNTPQIWKFVHINDTLIYADRVISAYDVLPILFGQPLEDGLGDQTQSIAEGEIPFQEAASTLFNIRFATARRAVSDRALFDVGEIDPKVVNTATPALKIPVRLSSLSKKSLSDLYHQIPFDSRGLENVLQDAQTLVGFSKELHGGNAPRTGQFQKGNKSVQEWNDTMAGSDNRYRLPAMTLEYQVFVPLKSIMVLNIYQYGSQVTVVSQKNGNVMKINIDELRKQVLSFRIADGFTPKSKMASMDMVTAGMQMIQQSPYLQQAYGAHLPGMFAHMMSLGGVRGLEEYDPRNAAQAVPAGGLGAQTLQQPVVQPQQDPVQPSNPGATTP